MKTKGKTKGIFIAGMNEAAIELARRLGVPLAEVQREVLSKEWRKAQLERATKYEAQIGGVK